jgi:hypothetical protein
MDGKNFLPPEKPFLSFKDDQGDGLEFLFLDTEQEFIDVRMTERNGKMTSAMTLDRNETAHLRAWLEFLLATPPETQ